MAKRLTNKTVAHPVPLPTGEGTLLHEPFYFAASARTVRSLPRGGRVGVRVLTLPETTQANTRSAR